MQNQPTGDQTPAERTQAYPNGYPPSAPADPWQSEWFALPRPIRSAPAYPPPEYYGATPTPRAPAADSATPLWGSAPDAPAMPGVANPHEMERAYPAYAPDGRLDPTRLDEGANPHVQKPSGRPEAAGCASGAAIIGVLSKLLIGVKFLLPLLSVIVSFGVYAALWGWQFALGIIVLLFVHEMGHFVVIRAKGLPAGLPVFIPLLGAYVAMRSMPHNVRDEAEIGIAGPIAGALAGLVCLGVYFETGLPVMIPLAYFSFLINLLNLVPVAPLDGARVTAAISRWFWPVGLVMLAVGVYYTQSIFLILIGVIGLFQMIERFRESPSQRAYYAVSPLTRVYITTIYFGLIATLVLALYFTQHLLPPTGVAF